MCPEGECVSVLCLAEPGFLTEPGLAVSRKADWLPIPGTHRSPLPLYLVLQMCTDTYGL